MREYIGINNDWQYAVQNPDGSFSSPIKAVLPHTNKELPYNCFNESEYQFKSRYSRILEIPETASSKRIFIDFEGVMATAEVLIDGIPAGTHYGGYTGFSMEITELVEPGKSHQLTVITDASENPDIPPFGNVIDYLTYGGIYREVQLRITDNIFIEDVVAVTGNVLEETKTLNLDVTLSNPPDEGCRITAALFTVDGIPLASTDTEAAAKTVLCLENLSGIELWDIDRPVLYLLKTSLYSGGLLTDCREERIGFRTCRFSADGFYLNGRKLMLRGLNRHQAYPHAGYAMPERVQKKDADILKYELGLNLVRTSHYPQSRHFLDRCDEIGLLVFEELPGWQHIGGEQWKQNALSSLEEMITRDRNRPSIIIWGVRINESQDDHDFYTETNRLAHKLDATRQTGGVRYIEHSELLEDVYTMNDFIHSGKTSRFEILRKPAKVSRNRASGRTKVPYLVTEYNGHMFPTKRFDNEERIREHALRHLRVLNRAAEDKRICGAVGWCAFDYNTHREFGSGDRICYHGVSDMFRIPKAAAAVYASQKPPEAGIVLEPATIFAKGERSAVRVLPIEVYTNCDFIRLYRNETEVGDYYPATAEYRGLEHPPVIIRDLVGSQLKDSRFSVRDQKLLKDMISYVMLNGEEALKPVHYLKMGLFMRRNRMKFEDLVSLFLKYNTGWGDSQDSFELAGFYKGREVIRRKFGAGSLHNLSIEADDLHLNALTNAGTWDSTRIVFRLTDQYGNIMPFASEALSIEVDGPAELIGPSLTAFTGGVYAAWIRTIGIEGTVKIKASCSRLESGTLSISIAKPAEISRRAPAEEPSTRL